MAVSTSGLFLSCFLFIHPLPIVAEAAVLDDGDTQLNKAYSLPTGSGESGERQIMAIGMVCERSRKSSQWQISRAGNQGRRGVIDRSSSMCQSTKANLF